MKKITSIIAIATSIAATDVVEAQSIQNERQQNPYSLVYDGAITQNEKGKVNIHPVTYKIKDITIAANVYTPADYIASQKYPAIVIAHPNSGAYPNSGGAYTLSSLLDLMSWDATDQIELINQPLLMIAGSRADSYYMTDDAFNKAINAKNKELFLIQGATHIETYWKPEYVSQAVNKLLNFYQANL